ncbi:hypothetical protein PTSG_06571 [Salpingoeca rosetta]|uniref:Sodium/hydrogen exchanger n=1 Tax=Salpingoeca rosetta (strain ATCC 50818 / BSB-021) TaxID=946362 RepID=F2UG68_SALR5|nr:uncharacterized protein PTSG_06571 [Salpingoeca rosetta]EGD75496.1 hypothetical protein PTSG_06571 [Salpingoeca rosetta]|eukprot:XP_004991953.1 hypothetical protein PTSG_06571 [Salpingoeca rosetta]
MRRCRRSRARRVIACFALLAAVACLAPASLVRCDEAANTSDSHAASAEADSHGAASAAHSPEVCPANVSTNPFYKAYFDSEKDLPLGSEGFIENLEERSHLEVFAQNYKEVELPFLVSLILLIVALLRVGIQGSWIGEVLPDSCMVIVVGVFIGIWIRIIFEAGYVQCNNRVFMDNLGSILINAILGTVFNTFALGYAMYGVATSIGIDMSPIEGLVFGSFIAAVDPVAVLTVFEEMHVHETLHTIVFGESILNDGVAVVLYRICVALAYEENITGEGLVVGSSFATGIASFVVVFVGGCLMGILHGVAAALVTRFLTSENTRVMEPFILIFIGYMSYLVAEICHFSGIVSIMICGMVLQHYAAKNIHKTSRISVHYFLKLIAGTAETLVFLLLGVEAVTSISEGWNTVFIISAYLLALTFRIMSVFCSSFFLNKIRHLKISLRDQWVMAYGGLRGAIAFSLAFVLADQKYICTADFDPNVNDPDTVFSPFPHRNLFVSATIFIVMITVFVHGTTIKPILNWLHISRAEEHERLGFERLNFKLVDYTMRVVESITQIHTSNWLRDFYFSLDLSLRKYLVKPGGSYCELLERAEEKHMKSLLESYKDQRVRDLVEADERGLHERELENYRWLKMHENFRKVMHEIGEMADVAHHASPRPLRRHYYDELGKERAPGPCERLVATVKHEHDKERHALNPEMQRARNRRTRVQFTDPDEEDRLEMERRQRRDWKYTGDFRARDLESALPARTMRRRHKPKAKEPDTASVRSASSVTSQESFDSSSTVSGLLSDGELNLVRRFASDSNLAPRSHTQAFVTGETWIPIPPADSDSSDAEQNHRPRQPHPHSQSQPSLVRGDSRPLLQDGQDGLDPIEEIEF